MKKLLFALLFIGSGAQANDSYCSSIHSFATSTAYVVLKNSGAVSPKNIDYDKTKTVLLSTQKISDDLYKEIHHITFFKKDGETIEVITVNDTSSEECSMSGVDIYLIDKKISNDYRPKSFYRTDKER
jgi:hypothetical protein